MTATNDRQIVRLTRIKQWYMPVDADSYKIMRTAGVSLLRIHTDLMPTIKALTRKLNIRSESVDFQDAIMNPHLDKLSELWRKKANRTSTITSTVLKFETTHKDAYDAGKIALPKLEEALRRFFARWGYSASYEISESRHKLLLHVRYKYDSSRSPILSLVEDKELLPQIKLDLGFIRLTLTPGQKDVEVNVSQAHGSTWQTVATTTCLYDQVSDVRPMINALMGVIDKDQHNADNRPK